MQRWVWFLLVVGLTQGGCSSLSRSVLSDVARNRFAREHSCPEDRMTMNAVSVKARDLLLAADPPPEVAAEPARLAVWTATKHDAVASYGSLTAIRVRGCDVERTYLCWDQRAPYGDERDYLCHEVDLGDANAKLGTFPLSSGAALALQEELGFGLSEDL